MANAIQESVDCQQCLDRELAAASTVYLTLEHHDDATETVTRMYECDQGHSWSETVDE